MENDDKFDVHEFLLEAHREGVERAIETSIRTQTPLVIEKDGKIQRIMPKYKYVLVPIKEPKPKRTRKKSK